MTLDQFIEHLGQIGPEYFPDGCKPIYGIRGRLPVMEPGGYRPQCCPITAVCHKITGLAYWTSDYFLAAADIEIPESVAHDIIYAADAAYHSGPARATAINELRGRMLQAINNRGEQQ